MALLRARRGFAAVAVGLSAALALSACGSASGGSGDTLHVTLITKDPNDPFWVAMINGAKQAAGKNNVELTVASGRDQTDSDGQIQAIENATTRGDDAIMIANNGPAVNDAIKKAKDAGLFVIALDTPTTPPDLVSGTFASDNFKAGQLIGKWTAGTLGGKKANIAMLDLFGDKIVAIDNERDQGFLDGMGIKVPDASRNGSEARTGTYSQGDYEVVCHEASNGAEDGGRGAMEKCLSINPGVNVVYTANEPSAMGAVQALKAAGNNDALVVTINGSCDGLKGMTDGQIAADAQQYPSKMGADGIAAVVAYKKDGTKPKPDAGKQFTDTGINLVTDKPVDGLQSVTSKQGTERCY